MCYFQGLRRIRFCKWFILKFLNGFGIVPSWSNSGRDFSLVVVEPGTIYLWGAMGRILAIDYGSKKTGLAVTDPLQIIASGLTTIPTDTLIPWLKKYIVEEEVEAIVLGEPLHEDGAPAQLHPRILILKKELERIFPNVTVVLQDERYTSEEAKRVIMMSGAGKKKRQDKALVDQVSAAIILQAYMQRIGKY